jgi:hypothetical protein
VLGLAVAVLVADVGRPSGDTDREEGQQRCDEVGPGMNRLRDQSQAARGEADGQLQRDERPSGRNGYERRPPLRAQSSSSGQTSKSCSAE